MLDHFVGLTQAFQYSANKTPPPPELKAPKASSDNLDPEWATRLPAQLRDLVTAWRDPAAWEGDTEAGGVPMPAPIMGCVAMSELVLHGWDLAKATGQPFTADEQSLEAVHVFTSMMAEPGQEASREGLYGPVVPVPDDAPMLDRVLGLAGRSPDWAPQPEQASTGGADSV